MTDTINTLRVLLIRELEALIREIELVPDDEVLWQTRPGVTNSCGNLALHLAGNLQHYVGHVIGGTSYVRNRDREFHTRSGSRAAVIADVRLAIGAVDRTLRELQRDRLDQPYPQEVGGVRPRTGVFLFHLVSHTGYHLGQAGYLRRILTGDTRTTGSIPVSELKLV
jgi:uncharacterized damage-inducible protein DinB